MIKLKNFVIGISFVILIAGVSVLSVVCKKQSDTINFQQKQIVELNANLKKAIDKTAISFSIAPAITNKVTSAFGSTKNVTLQYYFNLDGKAIIAQPDSTYHIVKEYN